MVNILWRTVKWRLQHPITIVITILQPLLWLVLFSAALERAMRQAGIDNYTAFMLPGVIVLVTFSACSSGGIINYIMKGNGGYYRVLIAPVRRSSIVLGQMLEAVLLSFAEIAILLAVSQFLSVRLASGIGGFALMLLLVFLTAFFMSGLAYTLSLILPDAVIYETIMTSIVLPVFFLSSALFPADGLSGGMAAAVNLNPFTHVINALRGLMFEQAIPWGDILPVILLFTAMCAVIFLLAIRKLKQETAR